MHLILFKHSSLLTLFFAYTPSLVLLAKNLFFSKTHYPSLAHTPPPHTLLLHPTLRHSAFITPFAHLTQEPAHSYLHSTDPLSPSLHRPTPSHRPTLSPTNQLPPTNSHSATLPRRPTLHHSTPPTYTLSAYKIYYIILIIP